MTNHRIQEVVIHQCQSVSSQFENLSPPLKLTEQLRDLAS